MSKYIYFPCCHFPDKWQSIKLTAWIYWRSRATTGAHIEVLMEATLSTKWKYSECKPCVMILDPLCSHNKLTELPSGLWRLTNLRCLHLQQNLIEQIPQDLGQLVNLDDLVSDWDLVLTSNKLSTFEQHYKSLDPQIVVISFV